MSQPINEQISELAANNAAEQPYHIEDDAITDLNGEFAFLNNTQRIDWSIPTGLPRRARSVEAAYMAARLLGEDDQMEILRKSTGVQSKDEFNLLAQDVERKPLVIRDREDRLEIMRACVLAKYVLNPKLRDRLLATGDRQIVEVNDWNDTFWGVCNGVGQNWAGRITMEVRAMLRDPNFVMPTEEELQNRIFAVCRAARIALAAGAATSATS